MALTWWGPLGSTTTVAEMDLRPGGKWRYVSSTPDRDDIAFYGEFPGRGRWTTPRPSLPEH